MTQSAMNRSLARITGESVTLIRKLGFSLLNVYVPDQQQSECHTPTDKSQTSKCDLNHSTTNSA